MAAGRAGVWWPDQPRVTQLSYIRSCQVAWLGQLLRGTTEDQGHID